MRSNLHPIFESIVGAWQSAQRQSQLPLPASITRLISRENLSGTPVAKPVGMNARTKLIEYHGSNRATFECPDGHRFKTTVMPKSPLGKLPSEEICRRFARYWQNTGVIMKCPKCKAIK